MAIDTFFLPLLVKTIKHRQQRVGDRRLKALALAYPDLLVPRAKLEETCGPETMSQLRVVQDAEPIWRWHGMAGCTETMFDTLSLFEALGLDTDVIDIVSARGMERIVDLNEPLPDDLRGRFDLVIDTGTLEHCFNVGVAFRNACEAVTLGGFLVHGSPLNIINHGFWNFSPTIYPDYFQDNGFAMHVMKGAAGSPARGFTLFDVQPFQRFDPPPDAGTYVVAERVAVKAPAWPTQRKYRKRMQ